MKYENKIYFNFLTLFLKMHIFEVVSFFFNQMSFSEAVRIYKISVLMNQFPSWQPLL